MTDLITFTNDHNANLDTIEEMIDKHGLSYVVDLVAEVCIAKADHVRETWQDRVLERTWNRNAEKLLNVSVKLTATS
jgi:histidinol-phosphate/aromatic aminotransferase/cobyric acid decarboxylase-like protein